MTNSQRNAREIESARRIYANAIGTAQEELARTYLERVLEQVRQREAMERAQ